MAETLHSYMHEFVDGNVWGIALIVPSLCMCL